MTACLHPGLGIIDSDLCIWAKSATPAMIREAWLVPSHPTIKAKPGAIEGLYAPSGVGGWVCGFNRWVSDYPILASVALAGVYLLLRRGK